MSSSHMEPGSSRILDFASVLRALEERGRAVEAIAYKLYVVEYMNYAHQMSEEDVLKLSMDEVNTLLQVPPKPLRYRGWDTFYWGGAVLG